MSLDEINAVKTIVYDTYPQFGVLLNDNIDAIIYVLALFMVVGFMKYMLRRLFKLANPYTD